MPTGIYKRTEKHLAILAKNLGITIGDKNIMWQGLNASYIAKHERIKVRLGKPQYCEKCKTTEDRRYEWANLTGNYDDVNDYIRLCVPCHRRMDGNMPINRFIRAKQI